MTVYLVGAGPGDPGLLTRRGAALLARADVVLHDRLVSPAILDLVPTSARLIDVGKDPDGGPRGRRRRWGWRDGGAGGGERQEEIARLLVEHGRTSAVVVRLKGGDPFLFGRGGEEVEVLARAGIAWEVVPGVTSAFGVPAAVGIPVTQRGLAASVTVVTGRVGEPDGTSGPDWEALARVGGTLVILMGMTTRAAIADALVRGGRAAGHAGGGDRPGDDRVPARGAHHPGRPGRRRPRAARRHRRRPGGRARRCTTRSTSDRGPLDRSHRGRDACRRTCPRPGGRTRTSGRHGARVAADPSGRSGGRRVALRAAAASVRDNDWVVVTSITAADRFMGALRDARALGGVRVAAVGPATADALRRSGVEPDLVPAEHSARGLVEEFPDRAGAGSGRVLFPCADLAPGTIAEGLGQKGWDVRRVEAYRTVARAAPEPALCGAGDRRRRVDASPPRRRVQAFMALRTAAGGPVTPPAHVVCIGPTTAAAARAAGLAGVHEAWGSSAQGIVDELIGHLGAAGDADRRP